MYRQKSTEALKWPKTENVTKLNLNDVLYSIMVNVHSGKYR